MEPSTVPVPESIGPPADTFPAPLNREGYMDTTDKRPRILIERADFKTRFLKGHAVSREWKKTMGGKTRFQKGQLPWNAGKRKYKFCVDCNKQLEGYGAIRCKECYKKFNMGANHTSYGKKQTKERLEENRIATTKKWQDPEWREKVLRARIGTQAGEKSSNWKGGISFEPYGLTWKNSLKREVRKRDGYKCQICGVPQQECFRQLDVHHIDCNKKNCKVENLISLCLQCHQKLHHSSVKLLTARGENG